MVCNLHSHKASLSAITDRSAEMSLLPAPQLQSVGIHPWYAGRADYEGLEALASDPLAVAIGEAGFDRLRGPSIDVQTAVFRFQALLAERIGKPLIIHCVKAVDLLLAQHRILRSDVPWIVHGYRGKPQEAESLLRHGIGISLGYRFNSATAMMIPCGSLFIETDDTDADISSVAAMVGQARNCSADEIMTVCAENICRICPSAAGLSTGR